jgi:hypothetical protein
MRNTIVAACGAWAIAGICVAAQTPSSQSSPTTPPGHAARSAEGSVITVTGCLKPWTAAADRGATPSAAGAERAADSAGKFMLSDVTANSAAGVTHASYMLKADASVNLAAHLNHKVEITGTLTPPAHSSSDKSSTSATSPTSAPSQDRAATSAPGYASSSASGKTPTLKVQSVKMVADTCS